MFSDYSESEDGRQPETDDLSKDKLALRLNQLLSAGPTHQRGRKVLRSSVGSSSESSPVPVLIHPDISPTSPTAPSFKLSSGRLVLNSSPSSSRGSTLPSSSRYTLKASKSCDQLNVDESSSRSSDDVASCVPRNVPKKRTSMVSSSSHASDIGSVPPPLPARPSGQPRYRKTSQGDTSAPSSTPTSPVQTTIPENFSDIENRSVYIDGEGSHCAPKDESTYMSSHFADEPLYQFYTASVLERATYRQGECSSEDDYEVSYYCYALVFNNHTISCCI